MIIYLNTKEDFFNYLFDDMPSAVQTLQDLLDDRYAWKLTQVLENKLEGKDDDTHMIQEVEGGYEQFELLEDENAQLFRLGFTVEEAEAIIADPVKALDDYREKKRKEEEERLLEEQRAKEEIVTPEDEVIE